MGTSSPRRLASRSPSFVADLSTASSRCPRDHDDDPDDFEFAPLLPRLRRSEVAECGRTGRGADTAQAALTQPPLRRAVRRAPHQAAAKAAPASARRLRWHEMAFGSVRVPAAMDMGEIRRRLQAPRPDEPAAWAPWRLIRSLSCKGVEVAAVAAAAPVRLV